jgi:hypothetical protein
VAPLPGRPRDGLARAVAGLGNGGAEARLIGDCQSPRTALEAVFEGHEAARAL